MNHVIYLSFSSPRPFIKQTDKNTFNYPSPKKNLLFYHRFD